MKIFTDADAQNIEKVAQDLIKNHIEAHLAVEPYLSMFEDSKVKLLDDESLGEMPDEFSLNPQVFFSVDDHKRQVWDGGLGRGRRHEMTLTAEILTGEGSFSSEQKLRDALASIIDDNQKELRLLGFFEAKCDPNPEKTNDVNKVNPLAISGALYTLR